MPRLKRARRRALALDATRKSYRPVVGMQPFDALDDRLIRGAPSSLFGPVAFQFVQTETVPPVPPLFLLFRAAFVVLNDRRMTTVIDAAGPEDDEPGRRVLHHRNRGDAFAALQVTQVADGGYRRAVIPRADGPTGAVARFVA